MTHQILDFNGFSVIFTHVYAYGRDTMRLIHKARIVDKTCE